VRLSKLWMRFWSKVNKNGPIPNDELRKRTADLLEPSPCGVPGHVMANWVEEKRPEQLPTLGGVTFGKCTVCAELARVKADHEAELAQEHEHRILADNEFELLQRKLCTLKVLHEESKRIHEEIVKGLTKALERE
jgi:hypothetical protein